MKETEKQRTQCKMNIFPLLILVAMVSCSKEEKLPEKSEICVEQRTPTISDTIQKELFPKNVDSLLHYSRVVKNGQEWISIVKKKGSWTNFIAYANERNSNVRDCLIIKNIPSTIGCYKVHIEDEMNEKLDRITAEFWYREYQNPFVSFRQNFIVDEEYEGVLEVTKIEKENVRGKFQMKFNIDKENIFVKGLVDYEEVEFVNGEFIMER